MKEGWRRESGRGTKLRARQREKEEREETRDREKRRESTGGEEATRFISNRPAAAELWSPVSGREGGGTPRLLTIGHCRSSFSRGNRYWRIHRSPCRLVDALDRQTVAPRASGLSLVARRVRSWRQINVSTIIAEDN